MSTPPRSASGCGSGSPVERGPRESDFTSGPSSPGLHPPKTAQQRVALRRRLLVRRSLKDPDEKAYYYTYARTSTSLKTLVEIAGMRWAIEECFEQAKQLTGLNEYEVRSWSGWQRHVTLSMFAHAMLAVIRAKALRRRKHPVGKKGAQH